MPTTSGPFTPTLELPLNLNNPSQGSGNTSTSAIVIVNVSPFELQIQSGSGLIIGLIDPFQRASVPLDPDAGQQVTITPTSIGFSGPVGVVPTIYVQWYGPNEQVPGGLPVPIVPFGNLQTVAVAGPVLSLGPNLVWNVALAVSLPPIPAPAAGFLNKLYGWALAAFGEGANLSVNLYDGGTSEAISILSLDTQQTPQLLTDSEDLNGYETPNAVGFSTTGALAGGYAIVRYRLVPA